MKRPPTIKTLRRRFGDEGFAANLVILANRARRSRKRKEALRALIRLNTPEHDSDFIYHTARAASKELNKTR